MHVAESLHKLIDLLHPVIDFVAAIGFLRMLLILGGTVFAIDLLVLMETRWGNQRLLQKCLILSLLFHVLCAAYTKTPDFQSLFARNVPLPSVVPAPPMHVTMGEDKSKPGDEEMSESVASVPRPQARPKPWERFVPGVEPQPASVAPDRTAESVSLKVERKTSAAVAALPMQAGVKALPLAETVSTEPGKPLAAEPIPRAASAVTATQLEAPTARRADGPKPLVPVAAWADRTLTVADPDPAPRRTGKDDVPGALTESMSAAVPRMTAGTPHDDATANVATPANVVGGAADGSPQPGLTAGAAGGPIATPANLGSFGPGGEAVAQSSSRMWDPGSQPITRPGNGGAGEETAALPPSQLAASVGGGVPRRPAAEVYKLRTAPDHVQVAEQNGATEQTEAAVKAALKWLAEAQSADGRWSAAGNGAGRVTRVLGRDREGAGAQADTGVTGLALLALLASGHTHREGTYHESVRRGLEFLLRSQRADGSLGGQGNFYEAMYCHGIATFAMSEALGMTNETQLQAPVRRAVAYTINAQNPTTGGWRYQIGDPGDTSQLGWQFMALRSAELAGIPMPESTRQGIARFLQSVSSGRAGGLASYRPGEQATRTMTAEAIYCWQLLGLRGDHPAIGEATDALEAEPPMADNVNIYYWYYATLATYQAQGAPWLKWNAALRPALVNTQRKDGPLAGTWDPDPVWGAYGGRVYSTALSTLCLEVYYRFLPLYKHVTAAKSGNRS